ncbi:hypothetical protein [Methanobrevibacter arboriphilus]|uniref:hypothetical protein n=1 Tax=Methanobrevibacter arboriphilus TaxID=39441 RepID=UPI001CDB421C|nr:hypothetical protein [Methanobrevibacter arboriphilus]
MIIIFLVTNSSFTDNTATTGGAIYYNRANGGARFTVNYSNFTNNTADDGGVIYSELFGEFSVNYSNFIDNTATNGGVFYFNRPSTVNNFFDCIF